MREIKFRAWNPVLRKMEINPALVENADGCLVCGCYDKDLNLIDMPLMQYIGLKDKDGVEVYEDDVLFSEGAAIGRIVFNCDEGCIDPAGFAFQDLEALEITCDSLTDCNKNLFIGGNIYENPELLNK